MGDISAWLKKAWSPVFRLFSRVFLSLVVNGEWFSLSIVWIYRRCETLINKGFCYFEHHKAPVLGIIIPTLLTLSILFVSIYSTHVQNYTNAQLNIIEFAESSKINNEYTSAHEALARYWIHSAIDFKNSAIHRAYSAQILILCLLCLLFIILIYSLHGFFKCTSINVRKILFRLGLLTVFVTIITSVYVLASGKKPFFEDSPIYQTISRITFITADIGPQNDVPKYFTDNTSHSNLHEGYCDYMNKDIITRQYFGITSVNCTNTIYQQLEEKLDKIEGVHNQQSLKDYKAEVNRFKICLNNWNIENCDNPNALQFYNDIGSDLSIKLGLEFTPVKP